MIKDGNLWAQPTQQPSGDLPCSVPTILRPHKIIGYLNSVIPPKLDPFPFPLPFKIVGVGAPNNLFRENSREIIVGPTILKGIDRLDQLGLAPIF